MATTKFFLDTRQTSDNSLAPLKVAVRNNSTTAYINTGVRILPQQWDARLSKVINHPLKQPLNARLGAFKSRIDIVLLDIGKDKNIANWKASELKREIESIINPSNEKAQGNFLYYAKKFIDTKSNRTKEIYEATLSRIRAFETSIDNMSFEDVTVEWLYSFNAFLAKTAPSENARNIHMRNLRAIFNFAINEEVTSFYPFRKYKIKSVETPKRSLSVEQLRKFFSAEPEPHAVKYHDAFKLIFFLCGINTIDLCNLKRIENGRIEYYRAKTHKFYSIKVEPEAEILIQKYQGKKQLLNYLDNFGSYRDFSKYLNKNIKLIGDIKRVGRGGKKVYNPLFPNLTSYWARHSWATIAASLDIPKETIAAALGHEIGSKITSIYIDFDQRKVDEANRKVLDWVLYGKR